MTFNVPRKFQDLNGGPFRYFRLNLVVGPRPPDAGSLGGAVQARSGAATQRADRRPTVTRGLSIDPSGASAIQRQVAGPDPKLSFASTDIAMPALSGHWPSAKPEATQAV